MMNMPSYLVSKYFSVVYFCIFKIQKNTLSNTVMTISCYLARNLSVAPSHGQAPVIRLSAIVIFWRCFTLALGIHIALATGSNGER